MTPFLKNILAVVVGLVVGSVVNMTIVIVSGHIIPPPNGADITTMEGLRNSMHLMQPRHFIMPFLAHALGTLIGAILAARIAATHKMWFAIVVGLFFLIGGIANVFMLPAPAWFNVVDLICAYLPMGFIGGRLGRRR